MLLQFSIEPEAFKDFVDRETAEWRVSISNFMKFWRSHGVFVLPVDFDPAASGLSGQRLNDFRALVLNDSPRQYRRRKIGNHESPDWANVQSWADLKQHIGQFDLALLERTRAACLDLDADSVCAHYKGNPPIPIEVGRWNLVNDTCEVKSMSDLAKAPVPSRRDPRTDMAGTVPKIRDALEYGRSGRFVCCPRAQSGKPDNILDESNYVTVGSLTKGFRMSKFSQHTITTSHPNYNPDDCFLEDHTVDLRDEAERLPTPPAGVKLSD